MKENLFADFPYTTAEQWLEQIKKDLKGKNIAEMDWSPDGQLKVSPYLHHDVVIEAMPTLASFGVWQIGESFVVTDAHVANQQIHEALQGGVESVLIQCDDTVKWPDLLSGVELSFIHLGIQIDGDITKVLRTFQEYTGDRTMYVTVHASYVDGFPGIRFCALPVTTDQIADGLAETLIAALESSQSNPHRLVQQDLSMNIGMHYLVEIARLRALRILWLNLSEALGFPLSPRFAIEAHTRQCAPGDDPYTHMIRSTVMCVAAVLGGADRIYVYPSIGENHSEAFYRHIARNVHHLLRYESKLTELSDPVTGSYYIDNLTRELVIASWTQLLQHIKKSGR